MRLSTFCGLHRDTEQLEYLIYGKAPLESLTVCSAFKRTINKKQAINKYLCLMAPIQYCKEYKMTRTPWLCLFVHSGGVPEESISLRIFEKFKIGRCLLTKKRKVKNLIIMSL